MSISEELFKLVPTPEEIGKALTSTELFEDKDEKVGLENPTEKEEVIGSAPPAIRALYILCITGVRKLEEFSNSGGIPSPSEAEGISIGEAEKCLIVVRAMQSMYDALLELQWSLLRTAFYEKTKGRAIGIRKGWRVVAWEPKEPPSILGIFFGRDKPPFFV